MDDREKLKQMAEDPNIPEKVRKEIRKKLKYINKPIKK